MKLYMFRTVSLSTIRSFSHYTQQWYMSYRLRAGSACSILILLTSCQQTCMTYTTAVCTVKTADDGQRNCLKHVEFHFKNKFETLVHLVGISIRNLNIWHLCSYVTDISMAVFKELGSRHYVKLFNP